MVNWLMAVFPRTTSLLSLSLSHLSSLHSLSFPPSLPLSPSLSLPSPPPPSAAQPTPEEAAIHAKVTTVLSRAPEVIADLRGYQGAGEHIREVRTFYPTSRVMLLNPFSTSLSNPFTSAFCNTTYYLTLQHLEKQQVREGTPLISTEDTSMNRTPLLPCLCIYPPPLLPTPPSSPLPSLPPLSSPPSCTGSKG